MIISIFNIDIKLLLIYWFLLILLLLVQVLSDIYMCTCAKMFFIFLQAADRITMESKV